MGTRLKTPDLSGISQTLKKADTSVVERSFMELMTMVSDRMDTV